MQKSKLQKIFSESRLMTNKIKKSLFIIFTFSFLFFLFHPVDAAYLYFRPEKSTHSKKDVFIENLLLDTQGETINVIEAEISYPDDILEVKEISTGNSILSFWTNEPSTKEGKISFVGGKPRGYKGKDGKIVSMVFKILKKGKAEIKIEKNTKALLNDGKGTEAELKTKSAFIDTSGAEFSGDEWQKLIESDKNPPLPFKIKLSKDPSLFGGKYFISFATVDKETGIDYYEVLETPLKTKSNKVPEWKKVESPYLLEDQLLQSEIMVKAVDKAGNERIARLNPREKNNCLMIILFLFLISAFLFFLLKKTKKRCYAPLKNLL